MQMMSADEHPEQAGSSCGAKFADLAGNDRAVGGFQVVFLPPEHPDYPTADVASGDRGKQNAALRVQMIFEGSDPVDQHCILEVREGLHRSFAGVAEDVWS